MDLSFFSIFATPCASASAKDPGNRIKTGNIRGGIFTRCLFHRASSGLAHEGVFSGQLPSVIGGSDSAAHGRMTGGDPSN
jgi:hypothetical protein